MFKGPSQGLGPALMGGLGHLLNTWRGLGVQGPGARAHRGLGPKTLGPPQGLGARAPERLETEQFFVVLKSLLVGGWRRGGSQLKRLPQMWGPGGKRARDTPPTPPPPLRVFTLSITETIQHAPQGRRITLTEIMSYSLNSLKEAI